MKAMKTKIVGLLLILTMLLVACGSKQTTAENQGTSDNLVSSDSKTQTDTTTETVSPAENQEVSALVSVGNNLPLQIIDDNYRTYYEVFVYSYCDSDGNGIGDFNGLTSKLDYINDGDDTTDTDLGFNGIWLMPIMTSTTYHKYDVVDYYSIDPEYGTMDDFKTFMAECNKRGIKVIIDMVLNHTSSKNQWFVSACDYLKGLGDGEPDEKECPYFGYYNFSKGKTSTCTYNVPGTEWYYEAKFWSEMPDLNLANENLRTEITNITKYWLDLGVGGFRLDAAKEYYSGNDTANVDILTWYNSMVKTLDPKAYIVAEVWSDVDTYAKYYGSQIDSVFDFEFADSDGIIATAVKGKSKTTNAITYGTSVAALNDKFGGFNKNYIDAPFYTNHDMARSAGFYSGDERVNQTKIAEALNLFMSGSAFVYYGDELGMKGAGKDENKRAPMQWSADATAIGMCKGPLNMDTIKMLNGSLETQESDPLSIYNYFKTAIKIRNQNPEIARGEVTYLKDISNESVCVLKKTYNSKEVLLVFNIAAQENSVDLSQITLNGVSVSDKAIAIEGDLEVGEETASLTAGQLTVPKYGVTVIW